MPDIGRTTWKLVQRIVPRERIRILRLQEAWADLVGETLARRTWPTRLEGSTLVIYVRDSHWMHELNYLRRALLTKVRRVDPQITALRPRLGSIDEAPEVERARPPKPAKNWQGFAPEPPVETTNALMEVRDPALRDLLAQTRVLMGRDDDPSTG